MAYTTAQKVSDFTEGEVVVAEVKSEWIAWAKNFIDRASGLDFDPSIAETDELDGDGTDTLFTKKHPLLTVSSLKINDTPVDAADFVFYSTGRVSLKRGIFTEDFQNVEIIYTHGFAAVPGSVEGLATALVARTALRAKTGQIVDRAKIGDFSHSVEGKALDKQIEAGMKAVGIKAGMVTT